MHLPDIYKTYYSFPTFQKKLIEAKILPHHPPTRLFLLIKFPTLTTVEY